MASGSGHGGYSGGYSYSGSPAAVSFRSGARFFGSSTILTCVFIVYIYIYIIDIYKCTYIYMRQKDICV